MAEVKILLADEQEDNLRAYLYSIAIDGIKKARDEAGLDRDLLNKRDMAKWLGIGTTTLDELIGDGLPCAIVGNHKYFLSKQETRNWILNYNKK